MSQARAAVPPSAPRPPVVTAVVVTRGSTDHLPRTLDALAAQTRPPQQALLVDASGDGTGLPDDGAHPGRTGTDEPERPPTTVVAAPGARTFGAGVRAALADVPTPDDGWLWLLHDDSAPDPTALAQLLRAVEHAPSVAIAGCKQRTWTDPVRVLEVGVTTSRYGRRMGGLDEPEVDQGQYDAREDVLAVGTAGALVRRDVWDALGGTDPALGPYGDGLDLCRRARLAGHRVVVVPSAVVRHARASLDGGRPGWDTARSARARRQAFLHAQLVGVPAAVVPVVAVLAVVSGAGRALGRLVTKEPHLVAGELTAPWLVLSRPGRIARARRQARETAVLPRRTLRPLQVTWREVLGQLRDRRMVAAARRRTHEAPSELEIAELAALRRRRRWTAAGVLVVAAALDLAVLGTWAPAVLGRERLVGGSLAFGDAGVGELWAAATSWWAGGGYGEPAPPDPFLAALLPLTVVVGTVGRAAAVVLVGALLLAAVGAWFASGAATRSVVLRAWAVLVWVGAPALLVSVEQARLGAVLAHAALPWFVLGLARGVGAGRTDVVESGLVGAARLAPRAEVGVAADGIAAAGEATAGPGPEVTATTELAPSPEPVAPAPEPSPAPASAPVGPASASARPGPARWATAEPSLAAAAGAALAFAVVTAAAPVLLPAGLLLLLAVAPVARRRGRLLWLPLPALVLAGPTLLEAASRWSDGGWRLLVAEPGRPVAATPAPAWHQLLGWPVTGSGWLPGAWPEDVATVLPLAATGVVLVLAVPALLLRVPRARAARVGWVAVALGTAVAVVASRVVTGVAETPDGATQALASAAPGISLALTGALAAALLSAAAVADWLHRHTLGWRQVVVGVVALVAVLGPGITLGAWTWQHRGGEGIDLAASSSHAIPAVGRQLQDSTGLRVLALEATGPGVTATVLRHDGRQLTEVSPVVQAREADPRLGAAGADRVGADRVGADVADIVARLSAGATVDLSGELLDLGVGAILLPPAEGAGRTALAGKLDATPGLERVTTTDTGTTWRVLGAASAGWARVLETGTDGQVLEALPVAADDRLDLEVSSGAGSRLLLLAERADTGWHARLDGRALRAVQVGWQQAFELGVEGGHLVVEHTPVARTPWLVAQGVVLGVTILLAVPTRRRRGGAS